MMNIKPIENSIRLSADRCDKVVITGRSEFNWRNRKENLVLASIEGKAEAILLSQLLNLGWSEESQGWLDNWSRFYINFLGEGKSILSIGVVNRAAIMVPNVDGVLDVLQYEKFGQWLETQGLVPHEIYT